MLAAYNARGPFFRDRFQSAEDEIMRFLCEKIEPLIEAWRSGKAGKVISILNMKDSVFAGAKEKNRISTALDQLVEISDAGTTIREVLTHLQNTRLVSLVDDLGYWIGQPSVREGQSSDEFNRERDFFENLFEVPYRQARIFRNVLEQNLPYSTKHGVKGDEFETVFVVLDAAGANWNQYSFGNYLAGDDKSKSRLLRTRNLFYVCCSRSKDKLAVIDLGRAADKVDAIKRIFGADACVM